MTKFEKASEQVARERRARKMKVIKRRFLNDPEALERYRRMHTPEPIVRTKTRVQRFKNFVKGILQ